MLIGHLNEAIIAFGVITAWLFHMTVQRSRSFVSSCSHTKTRSLHWSINIAWVLALWLTEIFCSTWRNGLRLDTWLLY